MEFEKNDLIPPVRSTPSHARERRYLGGALWRLASLVIVLVGIVVPVLIGTVVPLLRRLSASIADARIGVLGSSETRLLPAG